MSFQNEPRTFESPVSLNTPFTEVRQVDLGILRDQIRAYVAGSIKQHGQDGSASHLARTTSAGDRSEKFWHEVKHGIYFLKVGSDLSSSSLQKAEELVSPAVHEGVRYDLSFLQDLFLTLSPVNVRVQPRIRHDLLRRFDSELDNVASHDHPLRILIFELKHDEDRADVSEDAVDYMLECINSYKTSHAYIPELSERALKIECAAIALLRRDGQYYRAADKAAALLVREEEKYHNLNPHSRRPEILKPMRLAATELSHIRIDQGKDYFPEAVALSLLVLTGVRWSNSDVPCRPFSIAMLDQSLLVEDGKSLHALECLAKICETCHDYEQGTGWLLLAQSLAIKLSGSESDSLVEHIKEKIVKFRTAAK